MNGGVSVNKMKILSIYKHLLRESQKFTNYNFRAYALRRIQDAFKENKALTDSRKINTEYEYAKSSLDILRRQVTIGNMFQTEKLVIEKHN